MAFNPAMYNNPEQLKEAILNTPIPELMKNDLERYYVEWWTIGDPVTAIESGEFSTRNLRHIVSKIIADGKRSIVHLRRLRDNKVIWNRK